MKREKGFTLLELVVVMATLMILAATAFPFYTTYRQRIMGSEALVMMRQIIDAEIMYYLENEDFYPPNTGDTIQILHSDPESKPEIAQVVDAINVLIPVGHYLDFTITRISADELLVTIDSFNGQSIFKGGGTSTTVTVNKDGEIFPPFH
jgi:type II secretory pathway pseudopilin PulG